VAIGFSTFLVWGSEDREAVDWVRGGFVGRSHYCARFVVTVLLFALGGFGLWGGFRVGGVGWVWRGCGRRMAMAVARGALCQCVCGRGRGDCEAGVRVFGWV